MVARENLLGKGRCCDRGTWFGANTIHPHRLSSGSVQFVKISTKDPHCLLQSNSQRGDEMVAAARWPRRGDLTRS